MSTVNTNIFPIIQQLAVVLVVGFALFRAYQRGMGLYAKWRASRAEQVSAAGEVKGIREILETANKLQEGQVKATLALVRAVEEMRKVVREFGNMLKPPAEIEADALQVQTDESADILYATMAGLAEGLTEDEARARAVEAYEKRVAAGGVVDGV